MEKIAPFSLLNSRGAELEQLRNQAAILCHVRKSQIQDIYPCTALQEGLLALTAQDPGAYVAQFSYEIRGDVSTEKLHDAWQQVATANPILRTRVVNIRGHGLLQVVVDEPLLWSSRAEVDDSSSDDTASSPMGLGTALTELTVYSMNHGGQRHLQWDIHHALYDGWSFPLLLEEVERAYLGEPGQALHPITLLIAHQLKQDEAETKAYWQAQFDNIQGAHFPSSNLLTNSPSPDHSINIDLSIPQSGCQRDFTITTILKAAWSLVVAGITNKDEALFGLTVSGRQAPIDNIESMVGPAIATVPVRVNLDRDQSVAQLLDLVQGQATDMIPFEQTGLQRIRRSSQDASLACNFQTLMVIQPARQNDDSLPTSGSLFTESTTSSKEDNGSQNFQTYPLVIECQPISTEIQVRFDFDSNAISREQVLAAAQSLKQNFERLFDAAQMSSKLRSFIRQEQYYADSQKIWVWNSTIPEATNACIHELICRNAERHPDKYAIRSWDGDFTYSQLDFISTKLAHQLCDFGIANTVVPLLFEKSSWMPVAVLAVLKAGAAPVAVDVSQPRSRLEAIVSQTKCSLILSSAHARQLALEVASGQHVLMIDRELDKTEPPDTQLPHVDPQSTLYVQFTSGSTGIPKGVLITHRNFASAITHQRSFVGFSSKSRVLDFASYAFDVAWSNLFNTLTAGGCLCIPSADERQNDLAGCLKRYEINFLDLTPSLARTLGRDALSQLDTMILGGEAAQSSDAFLAGKQTRVYNLYGPAECTPTITCSELDGNPVQIGHGCGVCTWLVNPDEPDELAAIGAVGELYVEGPLVGEGYLHNPEQTAAAFVNDPAWLVEGVPAGPGRDEIPGRRGRLYRTGDLVRYNEDGSLAFVGRKDTQIKIRGQRIELADIEHNIRQAIQANAESASMDLQVIVETIKPEGAQTPIIVAFLRARHDNQPAPTEEVHTQSVQKLASELSNRLLSMLPSYMVPTSFIPTYNFPVTTNGKADVKALRAYAESKWVQYRDTQLDTQSKAEVLNESEKVLQQIWMSVLNLPVEMVSVNKAFMRMGGDSISAMQVVAECRLRSINTTVADILKSSTIRNLAACCQHVLDGATDVESEEDTDDEIETAFPLSPIQQNFFDASGPLNHYNQSFILDLRVEVASEDLHSALKTLVSRHPMLRARFRRSSDSGIWEQFVVADGPGSFGYSEQFVTSYAGFGRAAQARQKDMDLIKGPVFAGDLIHVPGYKNKLVLSAHHLVVDLVSWRIIWQEIEDFVETGNPPLQPTTAFSNWCKRQARVASKASPLSVLPYTVPEPQLDFWGIELARNTWEGVEFLGQSFDSSVTEDLFGRANDAMRTDPTDIILGSLALAFVQTFSERALPAFWIEGHGREPLGDQILDASRTVGWFTTIYPLVLGLSPTDTVAHAIRLAKDVRLSVPGKGQPYFACRYHSESGREAFEEHGNVVEIQFNFTGRFQQLEKDEGLFKEESDDIDVDEESDFGLVQISPSSQRPAMIDITAGVEAESLSLTFEVHKEMKHRDALEQWTKSFGATLEFAVKELAQAPPTLTSSDLALLPMSYDGLDALLREQLPSIGLTSADVKDIYPCSPLQEGMLLSQAKESASYATYSIWECASDSVGSQSISPDRLEEAWKTAAGRHAVLSTVFMLHPEGQGFIQVELLNPHFHVRRIISDLAKPADKLTIMDAPKFEPGQPEHCFTICKSLNGDVACRLDIGHCYYDAASADILLEDIRAAYDSIQLPPAPPFRRVIEHVNSTPKSQRIAQWAEMLDGIKPCEFPTATISDTQPEAHEDMTVLQDLGSSILDFCKVKHITHSTFFQVAWAIVLSQFNGMHDLCFGSLTSGRDISVHGVENIVGPVATMLICRVDLREALPQVWERTMSNSIRHFAIQHTSLADIQHKLGMSGKKLFNTSLSIQGGRQEESEEARSISLITRDGDDAHEHDLSLNIHIGADNLEASLAFKHPAISMAMARDVCGVLNQTIEFLLDQDSSQDSQPLSSEFFRYVTGVNEDATSSFWRAQFEGTKGSHFPQLEKFNPAEHKTTGVATTQFVPSQQTDKSTGIIVRAAWAVLSARTLDSSESLFGITDSETPFQVPMRIPFDRAMSKATFLKQIQAQVGETATYQRAGLRNIARLDEATAQGCAFRTLIREIDEEHPLLPTPTEADQKIPLHLEYTSGSNGVLSFEIKYNESVIHAAQATRLLHQLVRVTEQLANKTLDERLLSNIDIASTNDLRDIWNWNSTVPHPSQNLFHDLISAHARQSGEALALCAWDGSLTYTQLDDLSTSLAHSLVSKGISSGDVVPTCFEKSKWTTVAAVAVMKSGGACLLIDPSTQPEDRIRALATRVGAKMIISSRASEAMAKSLGIDVFTLDSATLQHAQPTPDQTLPVVSPSDPLYIMFTSGSTGQPKGIVVSHANACSAITYQGEALGFVQTTRTLDFASYAFDASWWNMLLTFSAGGCLCVPAAEERDNVAHCIEKYEVTFIDLIPSVARHIEPRSMLSRLSTIVLAGEPVLPSDAELAGKQTQVINAYGPAECTPTATFSNMTRSGNFGIGSGAGLCTWVVETGNPEKLAAVGAVGELYLEGPLVSHGYISDPEKTAAAFIQDPKWLLDGVSGRQPGRNGRVYRTGDLVRYNTDGTLAFLGRKDSQVKVRGQRLELGEVEHNARRAFEEAAGTRAQVVADVAKLGDAGTKTLVSFVTLEGNLGEQDKSYTRAIFEALPSVLSRLETSLPTFMVPQHFIPLATIPHTPSGKIDRRRLLAEAPTLIKDISSAAHRGHPGNEKRAPKTETECMLQNLWADVLQIPAGNIGAGDSFFRLGGDSVGAMQLVMKARQKGVVLTVREIFQKPLLENLAALVNSKSIRA